MYKRQLQSYYIENLGNGKFKATPLPIKAQFAPINDLLVTDLNNDENLDVVIAGNNLANHYEYGPIDAMKGLILLGNGDGSFKVLPPAESGYDASGFAKRLSLLKGTGTDIKIALAKNNSGLVLYSLQRPSIP